MNLKVKGVTIKQIVVTGKLYRSNKRFKLVYPATLEGFKTANQINLCNGSMWGIGSYTGKKILIKRVNN